MSAQMMECGHAANGLDGKGDPACVICGMMGDPRSSKVDTAPPDLSLRTARCAYYGKTPSGRNHESNHSCKRGQPCMCEEPSSDGVASGDNKHARLAFFEYCPDKPHDKFYCGCWGWD